MPGAWDHDDRQRAEDGYDHAPPGASAAEELAHEVALAAALDRSRRSLSPDAQASVRMKQRLFEAMAEEGFGRTAQQDATRFPAPAPTPSELTAPLDSPIRDRGPDGPPTRPVGRPVPAEVAGVPDLEPDVPPAPASPAASIGRAAGEHTLAADAPGRLASAGPDRRTRARRARHVLPDDHPDQAGAPVDAPERGRRPGDGRPAARPDGRRRPSLRKRFGVVVTAVAALAVLAGVAATASRNALPGDALYGVKRVTESTGGAFTFGDQAEAARQLELARTRVDEIERLMAKDTPPDPATVTSTIDDFDRAASNGSRLMLSEDRSAGGSQLGDLRTWVTAQSSRMEQLRASMPQAAVPEADDSIALLERVLTRTEALRARTGCADSGTDSVDDLGPLPSGGTCVPEAGTPAQASEQSGTSESRTGSAEPESATGSSESTSPSSSNGGAPANELPPLLGGDPARSPSGESTGPSSSSGSSGSSSSSTTDAPAPLLPPITLPPLLPGLDPVTIG